jgi:hypothetical protein
MSLIHTLKKSTKKERRWAVKRDGKGITEVIMVYPPDPKQKSLLTDRELLVILKNEKNQQTTKQKIKKK